MLCIKVYNCLHQSFEHSENKRPRTLKTVLCESSTEQTKETMHFSASSGYNWFKCRKKNNGH